ncbi:MAG: AraC family transcriptional regulator, partial [Pedobacter sp.]
VEIFLNYTSSPVAIIDEKLYNRSIVSFRMSQYADVQMRKGSGCVAVCFYPGMAYHFFKFPMNDLANTTTPLSDLWKATSDLEDQLALCNSGVMRVNMLQDLLIAQLSACNTDTVIAHCVQQVQRTNGNLSVGQISSHLGLSQRQLSRKFQQNVGLSPKEYLRISRFIHSLKYLNHYPDYSLTEIALRCGYYDQAHFIRDYKEFTGFSPGMLLKSDHILY